MKERSQQNSFEVHKDALWVAFYGYPRIWSVQLSQVDGELGEIHKGRLEYFDTKLLPNKELNHQIRRRMFRDPKDGR